MPVPEWVRLTPRLIRSLSRRGRDAANVRSPRHYLLIHLLLARGDGRCVGDLRPGVHMPHLMKTSAGLVILASVIATAKDGLAQQLTGPARSMLVESTMNSCERSKGAHAPTATVQAAVWTEYCRCYGNGVADRLSMNDLKADPATLVPIFKAAEKACVGPVLKSLK